MNLEQARREYIQSGLSREQLLADPNEQLKLWLEQAAEVDLVDATAMTLATVNAQGQPSQRVVLLKKLDAEGLVFFTNYQSRKAKDISENPKVSANFAWLPLERQVKIEGVATKISPAESLKYFLSRPKASQVAAWASNQSQSIPSRAFLMTAFERMKQKFAEGEIPLPDFWGGYRIKPSEFEFWQGGGARLHDRFRYSQNAGSQPDSQWQVERLAP
ncbi:pyridoxamine 5'-phosphate oxidase [Aliikangiella sp. IMCC44653]